MKRAVSIAIVFSLFASFTLPVFAGSPDGSGPWADQVISASQGVQKNGSPVSAARSNPQSAVGTAENNTNPANFFSLGFGGSITLRFDNPISNGVVNVEATGTEYWYPDEKAYIELSADGTSWVAAGGVTQDGSVSMPERLSCARFVRITDISDPADFEDPTADAYDVDGVQAGDGIPCDLPAVPEFGLVTGILTALSSTGLFLKIKGII